MSPRRDELSDLEWSIIQPLLLNKPRGVARADDRKVLNGIDRPVLPRTLFATQRLTVQQNREFWHLMCNKVTRKIGHDNQHEQRCY